jgi:hypothetical protein
VVWAILHTYYGITRFDNFSTCIDYDLYTDASFEGLGACFNYHVYAYDIESEHENIAYWETLNVLVALCMWVDYFKHCTVCVFCDNSAAVAILNTSMGADSVLQVIARNVKLLSAMWDIRLIFEHIPGRDNNIADLLSRWHSHSNPTASLHKYLNAQPVWSKVQPNNLLLDWLI